MKILNHHGGEFLVAHYQGASRFGNEATMVEFAARRLIVPAGVSLVTVASGNLAPGRAILCAQLEAADVPYINAAAEFKGRWSNTLKPQFILDGLRQAKEYALVLDAADVLLCGDLSDIVARLEATGKRVLFGSTKNNHPKLLIDKVERRDWFGEFKYLNAGTCFGRTADLVAFYEKVAALDIPNPYDSEQFLVRHVFAEDTEAVGFDYECRIFQTFSGAVPEQLDENTVIFR